MGVLKTGDLWTDDAAIDFSSTFYEQIFYTQYVVKRFKRE